MAVDVGSAVAYLRLDTTGFDRGLARSQSALQNVSEDVESASQSANAAVNTVSDTFDRNVKVVQEGAKKTEKEVNSSLESVASHLGITSQELETVIKKADKYGTALSKVGKGLTAGVTLPIIALGTAAFKTSSEFESTMSKVQAISAATTEEMQALTDKAIEMGAKTKFSAKESADAFTYMAMAGWNAQQMIDGISGIMSLAAADGLDLATTSDIVTDALTAFGLQAKDSAHFADVLAQASSSANTNVSLLGESFKFVAPVAGALGFSVEDVSIALGLMANSGLKGSQAGTALRASLANLVKPTDAMIGVMDSLGIEITNADGSMKSLREIMEILRESFNTLSASEKSNAAATLFGKEAMSGMLAIINSSEADFNNLATAIDNADGRADAMAATMMDNVSGAIEEMNGAIETFMIAIGDALAPTIRKAANWIGSMVDKLNALSSAQKEAIVKIGLVVAAVGPLLLLIGSLLKSLTLIKAAVVALSGPVGWVIGAIGLITAAVIALIKSQADASDRLAEISENTRANFSVVQTEIYNTSKATQDMVSEIGEWKSALDESQAARKGTIDDLNAQAATCQSLASRLKELQEKTTLTASEQLEQKNIIAQLNGAMDGLNLSIDEQTGKLNMSTSALDKNIEAIHRQAVAQAMQEDLTAIAKDQYEVEKKLYALNRQKEEQWTAYKAAEQEYLAAQQAMLDVTNQSTVDAYENAKELYEAARQSYGGVTQEIAILTNEQGELSNEFQVASDYMSTFTTSAEEVSGSCQQMGEAATIAGVNISNMSEDAVLSIEEMYKNVSESVEKQMNLFSEFDGKMQLTGEQLLANMQSQVDGIRDWSDNLQLLAERGIDEGLLKKLAEMGPSGAGYVKSFVDMTDEELQKANEAFADSVNLSTEVADQIVSSYLAMGQDAAQGFVEGTTTAFTDYQQQILDAAGVPESVKNDIRNQYKEAGVNTVQGYDEGMQSYYETLMEHSEKIPTSVLDVIREKLDMHSPSQVMYDEGVNTMAGYTNGLDSEMEAPANSVSSMLSKILELKDQSYNVGKTLFDSFWQGMKDTWAQMSEWLNTVGNQAASVSATTSVDGSHKDGLSYVPYDGYVAQLHEGERVLTKTENEEYSQKGNSGGDTYIFNSPKQIDEYEAARLLKQTKRELAFDIG